MPGAPKISKGDKDDGVRRRRRSQVLNDIPDSNPEARSKRIRTAVVNEANKQSRPKTVVKPRIMQRSQSRTRGIYQGDSLSDQIVDETVLEAESQAPGIDEQAHSSKPSEKEAVSEELSSDLTNAAIPDAPSEVVRSLQDSGGDMDSKSQTAPEVPASLMLGEQGSLHEPETTTAAISSSFSVLKKLKEYASNTDPELEFLQKLIDWCFSLHKAVVASPDINGSSKRNQSALQNFCGRVLGAFYASEIYAGTYENMQEVVRKSTSPGIEPSIKKLVSPGLVVKNSLFGGYDDRFARCFFKFVQIQSLSQSWQVQSLKAGPRKTIETYSM